MKLDKINAYGTMLNKPYISYFSDTVTELLLVSFKRNKV